MSCLFRSGSVPARADDEFRELNASINAMAAEALKLLLEVRLCTCSC